MQELRESTVMLDRNLLLTRLEEIDKHLEKISPLSALTYQEFLNDTTAQDIVEKYESGTSKKKQGNFNRIF